MIASRSFRDRIPDPYDDEAAAGQVMADSSASSSGLGGLLRKVAMIAVTAGASGAAGAGGAGAAPGAATSVPAVGAEIPAAGAGAFGAQSYMQRFGAGLGQSGSLRGGISGMIADPNAEGRKALGGLNTFDMLSGRRRGRGALAGGY